MSLYRVECDGEHRHVEADGFDRAIELWRSAMLAEFGTMDAQGRATGWTTETSPESVTLLDSEPVIRVAA